MPQIDVHLLKDVLNAEQKKQVIEKLTDAIVSIAGENLRGATWVKIFEINSGEWGIGGKPLTTEAVKELTAGRQAA
jgi:4-oxalocrotonate tautomerase